MHTHTILLLLACKYWLWSWKKARGASTRKSLEREKGKSRKLDLLSQKYIIKRTKVPVNLFVDFNKICTKIKYNIQSIFHLILLEISHKLHIVSQFQVEFRETKVSIMKLRRLTFLLSNWHAPIAELQCVFI